MLTVNGNEQFGLVTFEQKGRIFLLCVGFKILVRQGIASFGHDKAKGMEGMTPNQIISVWLKGQVGVII